MSAIRLQLRHAPAGRIDLAGLNPGTVSRLAIKEIERLALGRDAKLKVGDVFKVSGSPGATVAIETGGAGLDYVGRALSGGTLVVEGDVGAYAGEAMSGGRLEIRGNAGAFLGTGMTDGVVTVGGSAGDNLGSAIPGEKFGMLGGTVHVGGSIGARAGERMRRGVVVVKGASGASTGSRMVGGTFVVEGGLGDGPGPLMRRGTLIAPSARSLLATFNDCGRHDLRFLGILHRYLADVLGSLAPKPFPAMVRRYAGDMATIGKGEILLTT